MGFKATEAVEALTYDFEPHVTGPKARGEIPEPTSQQIDTYREVMLAAIKASGIDPTSEQKFSFEQMDELMEKSSEIEAALVSATADLTGLAHDLLTSLPYRVKAAFLGWIMGQFFSPEA